MERYTGIAALNNEMEAKTVVNLLKERHMPHRIGSYHDPVYDGLFQMQRGWGKSKGLISCTAM